jgi:hypothetical protein
MEGLDVLTAAPPVELFEFDEGHVMDELDALALLNSTSFPHTVEETYNTSAKVRVSMCLTAVRSCVLHALPLLSALAGNFAETQQYFLTVVSLNDSSAYAHFCLALLHECMDLFDEVIVAYHTALNRNPYYLKALFNMAKF